MIFKICGDYNFLVVFQGWLKNYKYCVKTHFLIANNQNLLKSIFGTKPKK
jgi:hypothetical protein